MEKQFIQHLIPRHYEILRLSTLGLSISSIARRLDMPVLQVQHLIDGPENNENQTET